MSNQITIRRYHPDDYEQVSHAYQAGIKEVNNVAHQSFYNGVFPQLLISEFLVFSGGYVIGLYSLDLGHFRSFIFGLMCLILLCSLSLWIRFSWTKRYLR